ncbi:MAG: type II secretion system F family protein [Nanoarchaeota archaeon]|nr:type II secretion system F family protein [Nanoarchaeota archaeon]
MRYKYKATQSDGSITESEMDARDVSEVLRFIAGRGLRPISIKKIAGRFGSGGLRFFKGKITLTDEIFLSKYLGLMLRIGTSLLQAITILLEDFKKPAVRDFLMQVRTNLEEGRPFYTAFEEYPNSFSAVYINLVKAGETSGNLDNVFQNLTTSLSKEKQLKDQIKSALIYPVFLLSTSFLVLIFLVTFALPRIAKVFTEGGFEAPFFSRIVFGIGFFFGKFGWVVIVFLILLIILSVYLYKRFLGFQKFVWLVIGDIPVVRDILQKIALQRFASTFSSLIRAGIHLAEALLITSDAVGHREIGGALSRISKEGISKGLTLGEAFKRESAFPQTVQSLILISEKAGRTEEVLDTLADFYAIEIDSSLKTLISFLEPVLLLFVGGVVGVIAISVIVPIYQLTSQF